MPKIQRIIVYGKTVSLYLSQANVGLPKGDQGSGKANCQDVFDARSVLFLSGPHGSNNLLPSKLLMVITMI